MQHHKSFGSAASTAACSVPLSVIEARLLRFSDLEDLAKLRVFDPSEFSNFVG